MNIPKANQIYKHFKGNLYKIVTVATHTETNEQMVVYQALYGDCKAYVRPLVMFMEEVDKKKYPEVTQRMRFQLWEESTKSAAQEEVTGRQSQEEEFHLDPLLEAYLDASTCRERLDILQGLHHRITDDMITNMAIVTDFDIPEGNLEDRYEALRASLMMRERYEI